MNIEYQGNAIVNVTTTLPHIAKLTLAERLALFAIDHPNQVVWTAVFNAERGQDTEANAIAAMVSEGLISQQRANEISA